MRVRQVVPRGAIPSVDDPTFGLDPRPFALAWQDDHGPEAFYEAG